MTLSEELKWRGIIKDSTPGIEKVIDEGGHTFYIGTDPTADSMHIGHLSSFLISKRLKEGGHNPILLIGGATALIGDPRPTSEREMATKEKIQEYYVKLSAQAKKIFGFETVNNFDWSKDINFIDYLRDYGKYFSVNYMLSKDIVARRLETGITYTEFSYMIMQSLDFLWLFENRGCDMQVCGSDQWGNVTAGVDLIRKKTGKEAHAFTMPLVVDKDGKKFGKSEGNALWLDKEKTSSYELFQFFLNCDDSMIESYLKYYTFLAPEKIMDIIKEHNEAPEKRLAQKTLAHEIITFLHGEEEFDKAVRISESLFSGNISGLNIDEIKVAFKDVPSVEIDSEVSLIELLVDNNMVASRREAREFLAAGAITINDVKKQDENEIITRDMAIGNEILVIRRGKKKQFIAKFI